MKEFSEFDKEDQKSICEALCIHNKMIINPLIGIVPPNQKEFEYSITNMSKEATEYLIDVLKKSLPNGYK